MSQLFNFAKRTKADGMIESSDTSAKNMRLTPPRRQPVRVRHVMKKNFDMIDGMTTIQEALETMRHVETKVLIVKKLHEDDEYGILQIPDIAKQVLAKDRAPARVNVYEIMTKPVVAVEANMDIRYCARLFSQMHISRAPVMENGDVVGIVSHTDLVMKGMLGRIEELEPESEATQEEIRPAA